MLHQVELMRSWPAALAIATSGKLVDMLSHSTFWICMWGGGAFQSTTVTLR